MPGESTQLAIGFGSLPFRGAGAPEDSTQLAIGLALHNGSDLHNGSGVCTTIQYLN